MTNSISDQVREAWNQLWTDPQFEEIPFYIGVFAVLGFLIIRLGGFDSGGGGGGEGGDGC